jgi:hypothetical protein
MGSNSRLPRRRPPLPRLLRLAATRAAAGKAGWWQGRRRWGLSTPSNTQRLGLMEFGGSYTTVQLVLACSGDIYTPCLDSNIFLQTFNFFVTSNLPTHTNF